MSPQCTRVQSWDEPQNSHTGERSPALALEVRSDAGVERLKEAGLCAVNDVEGLLAAAGAGDVVEERGAVVTGDDLGDCGDDVVDTERSDGGLDVVQRLGHTQLVGAGAAQSSDKFYTIKQAKMGRRELTLAGKQSDERSGSTAAPGK